MPEDAYPYPIMAHTHGCEGHYDTDDALTSGVGIGEAIYCDGSCNPAIRRYRMHLIIKAAGFTDPRSFRVDAYATSREVARHMAHKWLDQQPLKDVQMIAIRTEQVPDSEVSQP